MRRLVCAVASVSAEEPPVERQRDAPRLARLERNALERKELAVRTLASRSLDGEIEPHNLVAVA